MTKPVRWCPLLTDGQTERLAQRVSELLASDAQFAAAVPRRDVSEAIVDPTTSWVELMGAVADGYADRPALGQRLLETPRPGGEQALEPQCETITYRQLYQRVTALAAALAQHGVHALKGERVATLGFCSVDYTIVDMAVPLLGGVSVPLHAGAPVSQLQPMIDETEPSLIACSAEYLSVGVELALAASPPAKLLVFDYHPHVDAHQHALQRARSRIDEEHSSVTVETLAEAIDRGNSLPPPPPAPLDPDRLAVIIYTSGSSGSPKGAMQPESLAMGCWTHGAAVLLERGFAIPAITLNYMPMSHTAGRAMLYSTLGAGGTAYFAGRSDLSTILEDLAMVRPTQLNFVPRIWELLHRELITALDKKGTADVDGTTAEDVVLADLRTRVLGGRYISALTGSAPISAELSAWVERLLDAHLINALGATESGSVVVDGKLQRPPITEYKISDVPELGYFSTDRPHPRGELLIKSSTLFQGYYKRPALTAEVFDEQGFYRTGDVVAELAPDELRYVDRRNNVLKLAQGEFVTISKLEAAYANCEPVHQIYVYGNGEQSYLLAVVVPTEAAASRFSPDALKPAILASLNAAARAAEFQSYEVPRDIIIESAPFTLENGLLSGIRKPARPNLKKHYAPRLEQLYADIAQAQDDRLRALRDRRADQPVIDTVCAAAGALLSTAGESPNPSAHFTELGGDSLSALTFANTLTDIFGIDVPVSELISPAGDLQSVADFVEQQLRSGSTRPTFASVHGDHAQEVFARDLTLDKFIEPTVLEQAQALPVPDADIGTVLLTGATGYLGRYLALQWLQRMEQVDGTLICLVRAKSDASARARLDAVFDSGDAALLNLYRRLAASHLVVIAGDKGQPGLGLNQPDWTRLADTVDLIVDPAALVNHLLPYRQLFGPNVLGTAELIRLALTSRLKPVAYVSSVAVGATVALGKFTEDADVRDISAARIIDDGYANGYATSKWGGEVLLREAHDLCGLPVTVHRCDMIMAEPTYRGQLNVPDMVTRLIFSVAATGLAPETLFIRDQHGRRQRAHFDGLPVDFVAESISTLSAQAVKGFQTFHVLNPHDDGIGLDEYVDWMIEAGCRIERISDYDTWYARFETALQNLPEAQRQSSLLPLLESYRHPQPPMHGAFAPAERFRTAVHQANIGAHGEIPHIGKPIIVKYLSDLVALGLLSDDHHFASDDT